VGVNLEMFRKQATAKFLRTDAPGALVTIAPPSALLAFGSLAVTFVALGLLALFGRVQLFAEARGVVRPDQPAISVHAPFAGRVLAVERGVRDAGHAGDALLLLDARRETDESSRCSAEMATEQHELDVLSQRLADWNETGGRDRDAAMALVLITQVRAQREKVNAVKQRCEALAAVVERSRVTFPVDAVVTDLGVAAGAQVREGDLLAVLVPASARLVGYAALPEKQRGEVSPGQLVRLKFDALPVDEVGAGTGHVVRMLDALPSAVKTDNPETGGVFIELGLDSMPASAPPRPGMTFTADVMTRRPRISSLLFAAGGQEDQ
jgi:multidrug resistance efflux pump